MNPGWDLLEGVEIGHRACEIRLFCGFVLGVRLFPGEVGQGWFCVCETAACSFGITAPWLWVGRESETLRLASRKALDLAVLPRLLRLVEGETCGLVPKLRPS